MSKHFAELIFRHSQMISSISIQYKSFYSLLIICLHTISLEHLYTSNNSTSVICLHTFK